MIDPKIVEKLAKMSRLGLSQKEIETFAGQLDGILDFFADLKNVETDGVKPVSQITNLKNATAPDEIEPAEIADDLLKCTKNKISENAIVVPKAL